jgi:hypothetical protein
MRPTNVTQIADFCKNQGLAGATSSRYTAVNSGAVLNAFMDAGYIVASIGAGRTKSPERHGYQRHVIKLRHPDLKFPALEARGIVPEITIVNAYDGTSSYRVQAGAFRQVCSNGLIAGVRFECQRVRHVGDIIPNILAAVEKVSLNYPAIVSQINQWSAIQLSQAEQFEFAFRAAELVLPDGAMNIKASDLLRVQRSADNSADLWTVFNRIQERALRGGLRYQTLNKLGVLKNNSTRGVKAVARGVNLNQALWDLAESTANNYLSRSA